MKQFKLLNNIFGWGVFAIAAISYLMTMEPTTSMWDCSEFIATSYKLEVGHPPGAPLYMMLARLASLLAPTPEDVPMMINGMNCIASAFCIMFLFWTITHLARRIVHREGEEMPAFKTLLILGAGVIGALSYAYTDTFWFSAVEGEVYALSSMFTALVVWLMLKWEENAERPTSMRWIILIAYLMGLSIGVHILNLLTIPALVMIWFFRRVKSDGNIGMYLLKMCGALLGSFLILGAINGVIIPYTVAMGAAVDTFAVNTLGMPVNSGMIIFVVVVFAALAALIWFTHSRRYRILNGITLAVTVILIGFGSYAAVAIRANANPPMNSNNPSNPHALLSLLNRDQYGNRPLLYGPYYSAQPLPMVTYNPDVSSDNQYIPTGDYVGKTMTWLNPETGKYEEREIFDDYVYPDEANHFMPRMWWHSRAKQYEAEWVETDDNHPTERVTGGDLSWYEPKREEDIRYFLDYQMGDMFVRYFMWNFVGRQDDIQLTTDGQNGIYLHGGWLSGIDSIDEYFTGPSDNLPSEMANNPARNAYFFLPLLLGLLGFIYQAGSDWRNFIVVSLLFVMMGIALVVYFNTSPGEPRERDYVYAGAFYAFSIWIGLGAAAIAHLFSSIAFLMVGRDMRASRRLQAIAVTFGILLSASVPTVLATENWDDHDRSGRYYTRDLGLNYLNTAPENAILINFGDNDTFPIWYCQEVEGVRPDVRVMNTSYLGGEWYIDEMKLAANDADGVPFTIPADKYSFVNDYVFLASPIDVLIDEDIAKLRSDSRRILEVQTYTISIPELEFEEHLTFEEMDGFYKDANDIYSAYDCEAFRSYLTGEAEIPAYQSETFDQYYTALLFLEAIESNTAFLRDMTTIMEYDELYYKLSKSIYLEDAIRLFCDDSNSLLLVLNNDIMRVVASADEIAPEERAEDFEVIGHLRSKVDNPIDGIDSDYILMANEYIIPVDKDAAIAAGIVDEADRDRMVDEVRIGIQNSYLTKDYLMMLDLLAHFDWKRPLSFTQPYIMRDYGISQYARYDGFCYTFVPIRTVNRDGNAGYIDHEKLYPLFMGIEEKGSLQKPLQFGNLADESVHADYFTRYNLSATRIREGFPRVARGFVTDASHTVDNMKYQDSYSELLAKVEATIADLDKAEALLDRGLEVLPNSKVDYTFENTRAYIYTYYEIALLRMTVALTEYEAAVSLLNDVLNTSVEPNDAAYEDDIMLMDEYARIYDELCQTAAHRGITAENNTMFAEALTHGHNATSQYTANEETFVKGDDLAGEFISKRAEWVKYYLQFGNIESFSPTISYELNLAMMDIVDVLKDVSTLAGSYEWVANSTEFTFDNLAIDYINTINRLTPTSSKDPKWALVESHMITIFDIYDYFGNYVNDEVYKALGDYLSRNEVYDAISSSY